MQTEEFWRALEELMADGKTEPTAVMCAEAVPWRCHRFLISDALASRGRTVRHILSSAPANQHSLTSFARVENGLIRYPKVSVTDPTPLLF
jgi:uncharacterized protein (DUF488 family)